MDNFLLISMGICRLALQRLLKRSFQIMSHQSFPGGSDGKESACNVEYPGLIPGSGRSPGEGNGNPLWDSCLGNCMDRGAWWAPVHGVTKSQRRLSDFHLMLMCPRISQSLCSYLSPSSSKSISKRWQREELLIQQ